MLRYKLIDAVKGLVQELWRENNRPSSNQKDVLKLRMGSRDRETHIKHFLDMTQTELYVDILLAFYRLLC